MNEGDLLSEYFPKEEIWLARRLFNPFYDKLFLDKQVDYADAVLLSIYMTCNRNKRSTVGYDDAKEIYLKLGRRKDYFRIYLRKIITNGFVEYQGNSLTVTIHGIEKIKEILGSEFGIKTYLIKSGETFSGRRKVEELIINQFSGEVYVCDPYCDVKTLDFFSRISDEACILLLTQHIKKSERFKRYLKDFMKEYTNITIKVRIHKCNALHDRFIVIKNKHLAYSVGTSLNGIGKKDCLFTELPKEIFEALAELFKQRWNEAEPLLA